jgi:hypothetical protein
MATLDALGTHGIEEPDRSGRAKMQDDTRILFCPFCRECFEGEARCPEHDLALVAFDQLPKTAEDLASEIPRDDEETSAFDHRFGRGIVLAGAIAFLVSFATTFVNVTSGHSTDGFTGFEAASQQAPNLWTVPFVGVVLIAILARRRSLAKMRGARLSVLLLGIAPLFAIGYSYSRVLEGAAVLASRSGTAAMQVTPGLGVFFAAFGTLVVAYGARRLGSTGLRDVGPTRADLDARSPIEADSDRDDQ